MAEQNAPAGGQQLQVKMDDEMLKGVYANMLQVAHTPEEFVLDFFNLFPPAGSVVARVMVSPGHMKRIVGALADNLKRYEEQFGPINPQGASQTPPATTSSSDHRFGFRTE